MNLVEHLASDTAVPVEDASIAYALLDELGQLRQEQDDLARVKELEQLPRCCGSEFVNKSGSMYIHHSTRANCPLHGKQEDADKGHGLRVYVGRKPENQAEARAWMANYKQWKQAARSLEASSRAASNLRAGLRNVGLKQARMNFNRVIVRGVKLYE